MATLTMPSYHRAGIPLSRSTYWVSNRALGLADNLVVLIAGCAMYRINPEIAVKGAMSGAIVRLLFPKDIPYSDDSSARANRVASICLTVIAVMFVFLTPGPHTFVPLFLCLSAVADGAYGIMRKFAN